MIEPRVALVTCAELPDLDPDDRLLIAPLAAHGIGAEGAVWSDPTVDWDAYDLVVLRSVWDYPPHHKAFIEWAASVPRLANPAAVVTWNTDKTYLRDLARAGLPVVETMWLEPDSTVTLPTSGVHVVKPAISAGSRDTERYDLASPEERALAAGHATALLADGRTVMVQPYLAAVDTVGETALVYFDGVFSHAVRKGPILDGTGGELIDGLYKAETIEPREPSAAELAVGARVLTEIPISPLLYARVDLVPAADGTPTLLELELTEPSLFLSHAEGAPDRLAAAIVAALHTYA
ncbi:ATP-grasp domain-containing protein [Embleya sp. MST-111070]|uniref:ATP-grasp domain-containing protein n=1 Tax=Embleya sp. MST-111070 TaxID=3398231 RepID=UPI003F73578F